MTVFGHSVGGGGGGGGYLAGKQVFPVDCETEVSQRLVEASHTSDLKAALECIASPFVDVNYIGAVCLKSKKTEVVLHDESAIEVRIEYEEFRTDVTALFLAAHTGNLTLVRKLLSVGADVNQKLFRGFATTAAVREGHLKILEILLNSGASQPACEEALLEASCHGRARLSELLMGSDMIRPHVAVHALVTACCRGFTNVVDALMKCGVDANAVDRALLQSSKPSLHTNADCTALMAAVVSRQVSVVRQLLQVGVRTDFKVRLGAWSWDTSSGEEFRVGAGLAEPYAITWCAVEYFEATGAILRMLLLHHSPDIPHYGRTLVHHAIQCGNAGALDVLLNYGANVEFPVKTTQGTLFYPVHMAARLGFDRILQRLIDTGCDLNSRTESGETALMICAKYKREECLRILASAGADFGLVSSSGQCASSIAGSNCWSLGFQQAVLSVIHSGKVVRSSNVSVLSPLMFVARLGDTEALKMLIKLPDIGINDQDDKGFTAVMVTAMEGHVEAFRLLVYAGADVKLCNKLGETAIGLSELNQKRDLFEKVLLELALEKGNNGTGGFFVLHSSARRGDLASVRLLTSRGYDVNVPDGDDYTPLMLAAREGHGSMCELLISKGARCDIKTAKGETALSLARKNTSFGSKIVERVIQDELARVFVLNGASVRKHTKGGKGKTHRKVMRMVGAVGVLRWGKSSKRNVICKEAEVGPSAAFERNRRRKGDAYEPGVFRVVTTKKKEFHFVCEGGVEAAEMWVRGIKLVTRDAIFGNKE